MLLSNVSSAAAAVTRRLNALMMHQQQSMRRTSMYATSYEGERPSGVMSLQRMLSACCYELLVCVDVMQLRSINRPLKMNSNRSFMESSSTHEDAQKRFGGYEFSGTR